MLKFNSFRSDRYLRSKFVEGRYFLASEASDMELEILDLLRRTMKTIIGDVAIDNAFKVSRLSATQLLIEPGEAWFKGLPFAMRSSSDQLVSGASLTLGLVPAGITVTDSPSGAGKVLTWTTGVTPTDLYRIVISATEEIITDVEDPFLKNANLTESTGQKIRILFKINIVSESAQDDAPVPYTPDSGAYNVANLTNDITISPMAGLNGELILVTPISGSQQIDGRDLELTITNDPALGGGVPIPNGSTDQQAYYNGKLIDSVGNEYHVNAIFNDVVSTQVIVRLDKEVGQPNPSLINGTTYKLVKREVYVTDDTTGVPLGKIFWPIATAGWDSTLGFVHPSVITDLRGKITSDEDFQDIINQKVNLVVVGGGTIGVDIDGNTLHWNSNFTIINPTGLEQQILANTGAVMVDGGTLAYFMDLDAGGTISIGNLAITSTTTGTTVSLSGAPDLSQVRKGNIVKIGAEIRQITAVDNIGKTITVSVAFTVSGAGTIYRDSFGPGTVPLETDIFVLAVRKGTVYVVANALELSAGHANAIYDEKISYPSGYTAGTNITLPVNTRNSSKPQYATMTKGELKLFVNQLLKVQGVDWAFVDENTVDYNFNLPNDSEIHFRIDSLPSGSVGGGQGSAGSLQAAYNISNIISIMSGVPVTLNGPSGQKLLVVNGDVQITGVIDPTGLELTPQASSPLQNTAHGIWVDSATGNLMYTKSLGDDLDLSGSVEDLLNGLGINALTRSYLNTSGALIPKNTPVYCPGAGAIAMAGGSTLTKSKFVGVTTEDINDGDSGNVAVAGAIEGFTGYPHASLLYLGSTDGSLVTTPIVTTGFYVVLVGLIEGTTLILRPTHVGKA